MPISRRRFLESTAMTAASIRLTALASSTIPPMLLEPGDVLVDGELVSTERFGYRLQHALQFAMAEATENFESTIGSEYLLLGLAIEAEAHCAAWLDETGLTASDIRGVIRALRHEFEFEFRQPDSKSISFSALAA